MPQLDHTTQPARRRSLRRAVRLETDVLCDLWDTRVPLLATDLSSDGLWLQSQLPLEVGEELLVSFRPPRWEQAAPLTALASVVRVGLFRRRSEASTSGMGLRFTEMDDAAAAALERCLRGLPPPLPGRRDLSLPPPLRLDGPLAAPPENDVCLLDDDPEVTLHYGTRDIVLVAEGPLLTGGRGRDAAPMSPLFARMPVRQRVQERLPRRHAARPRSALRKTLAVHRRSHPQRPMLRAV